MDWIAHVEQQSFKHSWFKYERMSCVFSDTSLISHTSENTSQLCISCKWNSFVGWATKVESWLILGMSWLKLNSCTFPMTSSHQGVPIARQLHRNGSSCWVFFKVFTFPALPLCSCFKAQGPEGFCITALHAVLCVRAMLVLHYSLSLQVNRPYLFIRVMWVLI